MRILKWLTGRIIWGSITLLVMTLITFFLMRAAPGNPYSRERQLSPIVEEKIKERYHLDQPLYKQYLLFVEGLATLDFGPSMRYENQNVKDIISQGLPESLKLGLSALVFAIVIGIGGGITAAYFHNRRPDYIVMFGAMFGTAVPNFVIGPILALTLGIYLPIWAQDLDQHLPILAQTLDLDLQHFYIFPVSGWGESRHYPLPTIALGLMYAAHFARLTRAGVLEVFNEDYVRTARAKGLPETLIVRRHILKLGLQPVVSFASSAITGILIGSVVIERIFLVPGIGKYFAESALTRDYPLLMTMVILFFVLLYTLNTIVDLIYRLLDPRIK